MNNIKSKINELMEYADNAEKHIGYLRSRIPLLKEGDYKFVEKMYIYSRESLMLIKSNLLEVLEILSEGYE